MQKRVRVLQPIILPAALNEITKNLPASGHVLGCWSHMGHKLLM